MNPSLTMTIGGHVVTFVIDPIDKTINIDLGFFVGKEPISYGQAQALVDFLSVNGIKAQ